MRIATVFVVLAAVASAAAEALAPNEKVPTAMDSDFRGDSEHHTADNQGALDVSGFWSPEDNSLAEEKNGVESVASRKDYLNALVQTSSANTNNQMSNIAFVKTHKTASTTMAAVLYRYARRHDLKLAHFGQGTAVNLKMVAYKARKSGDRVDIMHYHISPWGRYKGTWDMARANYQSIMRFSESINFVTAMREPRSHLLSYYYFYVQPETQLSIEEFLTGAHDSHAGYDKLLWNPLSAEFGAKSETEVADFIASALPSFQLILMSDRMDEGLLALRHVMGWDLIDVTYMTLNKNNGGGRRWDGKLLVHSPHFDDLSEEVQDKIDQLTELDQMLYAAGKRAFEETLDPLSDMVSSDLPKFRDLQNVVRDYLSANSSSMANAMYRRMDVYNMPPPMRPF